MIAAIVSVAVLDLRGVQATRITDGDRIAIVARVSPRSEFAQSIAFTLDSANKVGSCTIPANSDHCAALDVSTIGWHWAGPHRGSDVHIVAASLDGRAGNSELKLRVLSRPVVLVHGILSSAGVWHDYVGRNGFLASVGLRGYAVGDGRAPGTLDMGTLLAPQHVSKTIAQNAAILASYIAGIKRSTGAQMVDIVAHSMGGLVTRYYVAHVMRARDVADVVTLGTPSGGSDCAALPAALGFYVPTTLELRPSYVRDVFNRQVSNRRDVAFFAVAGTKIVNPLTAACTAVPSDLVVSLVSASAVEPPIGTPPVLHTELEHARDVFRGSVAPILKRPPGAAAPSAVATQPPATPELASFGRVAAGHIRPGGRAVIPIAIDAGVTLAGFALYDRSRSLDVQVRGASGSIVHLDAVHTGLVVVNDPTSLVTLGYGVNHPRPGPWLVTLRATSRTPPSGADFALGARLVGGASIDVGMRPIAPHVGDSVAITVTVSEAGKPLGSLDVALAVRKPNGGLEHIAPKRAGDSYIARWHAETSGLYGVDITANGTTPDGAPLQRSAFRTVAVR